MATEELNGIENTIKKEAEFFFKKYEIEETKDVPSNFLYYPFFQSGRSMEYRTIKLSNSTTPIVSF